MSDEHRLLRIVPPAVSDAPIVEEERDYTGCPHVTGLEGQAVLHEADRTVTCAQCGANLDPYNVLVAFARHYRTRIERPTQDYQRLVREFRDNERRKFLGRLERHQHRHPAFVGTCRICQRLEADGREWVPQKIGAR
jgi:hypothetical protein